MAKAIATHWRPKGIAASIQTTPTSRRSASASSRRSATTQRRSGPPMTTIGGRRDARRSESVRRQLPQWQSELVWHDVQWMVSAGTQWRTGDGQTEGGQCHVTCVRPRSEAAVLGTGPLTEGGQRHVTCVCPTSHASAHGQRRWHGGPLTEGGPSGNAESRRSSENR